MKMLILWWTASYVTHRCEYAGNLDFRRNVGEGRNLWRRSVAGSRVSADAGEYHVPAASAVTANTIAPHFVL